MTEANPTTDRQLSHTPGPWGLDNDEGSERYEIGINADVGVKIICSVDYGFDEPFDSQQHANARLIAAAPELLTACKAQHDAIDRLMADLIILTRKYTPDKPFLPTQSGPIWAACQLGNAAIKASEGKL